MEDTHSGQWKTPTQATKTGGQWKTPTEATKKSWKKSRTPAQEAGQTSRTSTHLPCPPRRSPSNNRILPQRTQRRRPSLSEWVSGFSPPVLPSAGPLSRISRQRTEWVSGFSLFEWMSVFAYRILPQRTQRRSPSLFEWVSGFSSPLNRKPPSPCPHGQHQNSRPATKRQRNLVAPADAGGQRKTPTEATKKSWKKSRTPAQEAGRPENRGHPLKEPGKRRVPPFEDTHSTPSPSPSLAQQQSNPPTTDPTPELISL
jgi:hypothetical protein